MENKNQTELWNEYYKNGQIWNKETTTLPEILTNKRVLEIGVGNGKTLKSILKQKPKEIVAIDISKEAIKRCQSDFMNKKIRFFQGDIQKTSFAPESFDIVVCYYTLNNLNEKERVQAVREINRILTNKGILIFEDFAQGDFRESIYPKIEEHTTIKSSGIICHFFNEKELKTLFKPFKNKNIKVISSKPIKNHKELTRIITKATLKKN